VPLLTGPVLAAHLQHLAQPYRYCRHLQHRVGQKQGAEIVANGCITSSIFEFSKAGLSVNV